MSRSRRKTACCGNATADSERTDKEIWHKRMRAITRTLLNSNKVDAIFPTKRDAGNIYEFAKDGKQFFNPEKFPQFMRK